MKSTRITHFGSRIKNNKYLAIKTTEIFFTFLSRDEKPLTNEIQSDWWK